MTAAILGGAGGAVRADALLSVAQANRVASAAHEQVKVCYFRHALVEPSATGQVRVDLDVRSDGGVAHARVQAPGLARRALAFQRCVVARALTWRFPASSSSTEVRMPFRFHLPVRFRARG